MSNLKPIIDLRGYPVVNVLMSWEYLNDSRMRQILGKALWKKVSRYSNGYRILSVEIGNSKFYKLLLPSITRAVYSIAKDLGHKVELYSPENGFLSSDEILADAFSLLEDKNVIELPDERINEYSKNFPLYPHQIFGVNSILSRLGYGLFFEMRTGKTLTTLIGLSILRKAELIKSALVIAPMSAIGAWERDVEKNLNAPIMPTLIRLNGKKIDLEKILSEVEFPIFITHYEFLITKKYKEVFRPFVQKHWRELKGALIFDESHRIKNPATKRFKGVMDIAPLFKRYILLSGTPIGNSIEDIWTQSVFLGFQYFTGNNITQFRRVFMIPHPAGFGFVPAGGSVKKIKEKLKTVSMFVRQKDVFKKLQVYREKFDYRLTSEQKDVYDSIANELIAMVNDRVISVSEGIARSIKLAQICSGFYQEKNPGDEVFEELDHSNRDKVFLDLIEDVKGNLVIWHEYNADIKILRKVLKDTGRKVFVIAGDVKKEKRVEIINEWRDTDRAVLLTKPSLLGEGIDLSKAEVAVYWNHNYSYINRFQSESRIIAPGKPIAVLWSLYAPKTIEESILNVISRGRSIDEEIKENNFYSFVMGELF